MPYDVVERSAETRRPVELYTFFRDYQAFRFTSADRNVTLSGVEYAARPISRSAIESSGEMARGALKITAPRDFEIADLYRVAPPSIPVTFTLQQYHVADNQAIVLWSGRVMNVEFQGVNSQITLESIYTSMRRVGLRRVYQKQCPHVLYGTACQVNRESYRLEAVADAVTGTTVQVADAALQPNGYFAGGFIEFAVELGIFERRFITDHAGQSLTLSNQPFGLTPGSTVRVYPGCDHTLNTCAGKFSNAANYGGFPYIPQKNPFGGDPIY
jgi:uncharacterized phage protein (TIGR02218 family)